jgi:hypothetical protein
MAKYETEAAPWSLEDEMLKNLRLHVLEACHGNRNQAAEILGTSRRGLVEALKAYREMGYIVPEPHQLRGRIGLPREFWDSLHEKITFSAS